MLPVVALVGRPNVGKSTLFNVLTRTRDALVHDQPGLTRDRHYGVCRLGDRPFAVVDTGGLTNEETGIEVLTAQQAKLAIDEADIIVFVIDARAGLMALDREILADLRKRNKPLHLVVNKIDGLDEGNALAEFAPLGMKRLIPLAAAHARGIDGLLKVLEADLPEDTAVADDTGTGVRVAIVGRPNVGKSTLVNRLLGEDRVIVSDVAGTTRDSIRVAIERDGKHYTLIDTAGVRRRARVEEVIEKFSVIKTLQSIAAAQVVVLMLDAQEGVSEQDQTLIGHVLNESRALVVAVNKWDNITKYQRDQCEAALDRKLEFVAYAERVFISAKHGSGMRELMRAIDRAYASAMKTLSSTELNKSLALAIEGYQPPLVRGHAPKMKYAHSGGTNPPTIIIHGTRTKHIAESYRRYLENFFRKRFKLVGTPIRIEFKDGENPFAGRKNVLTERQVRQRRRLIKNRKK